MDRAQTSCQAWLPRYYSLYSTHNTSCTYLLGDDTLVGRNEVCAPELCDATASAKCPVVEISFKNSAYRIIAYASGTCP